MCEREWVGGLSTPQVELLMKRRGACRGQELSIPSRRNREVPGTYVHDAAILDRERMPGCVSLTSDA